MKYLRRYGFLGCATLIIHILRTKILFPKARLIRFPIDIRNKRNILVGKGFTTGRGCRIESWEEENDNNTIIIGDNVQINDYVHIAGLKSVVIEDNVLIASRVYISDCTHGQYSGENQSDPFERVAKRKLSAKSVLIKENAWLGEGVVVLPGVTLGKNCIVGANSVVAKDVPDNSIVVGSPARIIKQYNFDKKKWIRAV